MTRAIIKAKSPEDYKMMVQATMPANKYDFSDVDWTKRAAQIAEEMGCSYSFVLRRRALVIPPKRRNKICWDTVKDLGKKPDAVMAEILDVATSTVSFARRRAGIKAFSKYDFNDVDWTKRAKQIAEEVGCSYGYVLYKKSLMRG